MKYKDFYVKNYKSVRDAIEGFTTYPELYNRERIYESLVYRTPHEFYFGGNNNDLMLKMSPNCSTKYNPSLCLGKREGNTFAEVMSNEKRKR